MDSVWVFNGAGARFPSGVFRELSGAEGWIALHKLSGILTQYPIDTGVYDWALARGMKVPQAGLTAEIVGRFTYAGMEHFHYESGSRG